MPEAIVEKEVCSECGADVRDDTVFCYNCGSRVAGDPESDATITTASNGDENRVSDETQAAFDDLAEKQKGETENENKLARAAEQRRKACVSRSKPRKIVWEPTGDGSHGLIVLLAIVVAFITLVVVLFTVVWK